jgi:hypothetical protein
MTILPVSHHQMPQKSPLINSIHLTGQKTVGNRKISKESRSQRSMLAPRKLCSKILIEVFRSSNDPTRNMQLIQNLVKAIYFTFICKIFPDIHRISSSIC